MSKDFLDTFLCNYHAKTLDRYRNRIISEVEDAEPFDELEKARAILQFHKKARHWQYNVPFHELNVVMNEEVFEKKVLEVDLIDGTKSKPINLYEEVLDKYIANIDGKVYDDGLSFVFYGYNESGKTLAAIHTLCSAIEQGLTGYYIGFKDLLHLHNNAEFAREGEESRLWHHVLGCDFLVIDEVGKESSTTDNVLSVFEKVVKTRSSDVKPTILVTNIDFPKEQGGFKERYKNSVYNALITRYRVFQFSPKGEFRQKTRKEWDL